MPNSRPALVLAVALALAIAVALGASSQAQEAEPAPAPDEVKEVASLDELQWIARPLVVFADSAADPRFVQQMDMLARGAAELEERRVVVIADADPTANGAARQRLRPRGFGLVLIDTDGTVVQRRPSPTSVRELAGMIDRLPSRREETGSRRP